jgi:hypothetical protein
MLLVPVHVLHTYASRSSPRMWQDFTLTQQSWMDPTAREKKGSRHNSQHAT